MNKKAPGNRKKTGKIPKNAFKKGQSGNPNGRPPLPEDVLKMRQYAKEDLIRAYYKFSTADPKNIPKPENLLEQGVLEALKTFGKKKGGSGYNINFFWDRVMGKPESKIDLTSGDEPIPNLPILIVPDRMDFDEWNKRFNNPES